jgi:tetratricopeptide (TPR) repeat protein
MTRLALCFSVVLAASAAVDLESARDRQDRAALDRAVAELSTAAEKTPNDANAQYHIALASTYLAEVALELRDKTQARTAAEAGIRAAESAIKLKPDVAEFHRVLGTLCGQVIPANVLLGLTYGKRSQEAIAKAIQLDPKSARAYLARGVGNYYLPPAFGGGPDVAIRDLKRALELDKKSADAYLWLGLALRKAGRNPEARQAFSQALALTPNRVWAKQQLDKTPAQ